MRKALRWIGRIVLAMVVLLLCGGAFVYWRSEQLLAPRIEITEAPLAIPHDPDAIERGRHLAVTRGCGDCHGVDFGGKVVVDVLPVGTIAGPNLTRGAGGLPADFGAADWERAIRHGVAPDGRMLVIMPTRDFAALTDTDLADMIAFLAQVPAVDRTMPRVAIGPIPRLQMLLGQVPLAEARAIDQHAAHAPSMAAEPSADYGSYLAHTCSGCHGANFSGGRVPGLPPSFPAAANITPDASGIRGWSKDDFYTAMRSGRRPNGSAIDPFMPWQTFKQLSDTELDALWAFLQKLPPRPAPPADVDTLVPGPTVRGEIMVSLAQLWLPILLSAVFVFILSSILHMVLRFWHAPDCKGFGNEGEVAAAIRSGGAGAGLYMIPYCTPEAMKDPAMQQKFADGPVGVIFLRRPGPMNLGAFLGQWFAFCVLVSVVCALLALVLPAGAAHHAVFHTVGLAALMAYAFGPIPDAIWWGHPWKSALKHVIDGVIYGVVTGLTFAWLWPVSI